jgi:hypothetical protein
VITKRKLRALSPGQWARTRIPDYECWKKPGTGFCRSNPGDEVDICVMPIYMPRYDDKDRFHWNYRVAYRGPKSSWANYQSPDGGVWITPWDFGLVDASSNSPNWDKETCDEHYQGKGKWLYEPASDDPELCPGADWSRYECDKCGKFVKPFSNDAGVSLPRRWDSPASSSDSSVGWPGARTRLASACFTATSLRSRSASAITSCRPTAAPVSVPLATTAA